MAQNRITTMRKPDPTSDLSSAFVFRRLVDSVEDYAIFMLDARGYVCTWNPGAQRINGYAAEEIIGQHFSKFYTKEDLDIDKPGAELRIAAEVGHFEDEGWRIRKDSTRFWASVVITAIRDDNGNLLGYGKIVRDLTERRHAEQRYRLIIEGVSDYAIFSLDPDGNITSWNTGAQRIKQYTPQEIIGQNFSRFYTPEDRADGMPQRVLETAKSTGHFEGEGWRVRKDGSRFWASVVVTAIFDEEGKLTGFSKVTRDVTERKQLLDQVRRHSRDLESTNAELESFSYSVSHDLRAPLRAIEGFAIALREDYGHCLDATATDYLNRISLAAVRMNRLVQDLLNYSRLSRTELVSEPTELRQTVEAALAQIEERDHYVEVKISGPCIVLAHQPTLVQVLLNLITNGLKFNKPGTRPHVTVSAKCEGKNVRVSVTDNGIGIDAAHQERIFNVFERLHGNDTYPGTGIGLAIVKRGIERMGGQVGLDSKPGSGSTFWFELAGA